MVKDRRVSIETIRAQFYVSVGTVHTIIREELKMRKICAKFVPRVLGEGQKERRCHDSREMVELINSDPAVLDALVTCDESYDPETKRQSSQWKHAGFLRPKKARQSKFTNKLLMIPFFDTTGMIYMHWVPTGQTVNKEIYVEVLREFRKRFRRKRPALFKSGRWHFQQDNAPVHNSILVTDYLTKMGIKTVPHPPYCPDLAPCDFWLFPKLKEKLRGCRYETIEEKRTSMGPSGSFWNGTTSALQLEEITWKGTRVSCVYNQKNSGNLLCAPCMYAYIYIHIFIYLYIYIYIYMHIHLYTNEYSHTHTHTHIYIYIYMYIYTTSQKYLTILKNFHFSSLMRYFK